MTSPKGFPIEGRREDLTSDDIKLKALHSTVTPMGSRRRALDVNGGGYYEVSAAVAVEAGSSSSRIVITGHSIKKGDLIRITSSANGIEEEEMFVNEIVDANTVQLAGDCSAEFAAADTIDIYRYITQKLAPDGGSTATLTAPPIQINRVSGAVTSAVTVVDDLDTPANTIPVPVKLFGVTGNLSITSDELNVQLSHSAASPDSIQIGDGVETVNVNASSELQTRDDDANTALGTVNTNLGTIETDIEATNTLLTSLATALASIGTDELRVNTIANALPTGAATETTLASSLAILQLLDNALASIGADELRTNVIASALPTGAATESTLQGVRTAVELIDNAIAGTEMQVDIVDAGPIATQATLLSIQTILQSLDNALVSSDTDKMATESDQLPVSLGVKTAAASLSVTMASDAETTIKGENVLAFAQLDYSASNLATGAYTQLIGDIGATAGKKVVIFHSSGTPVYLATGAAAAEVDRMIVIPGGFNHPVEIELAANSRLSLKSIGAAVSSGQMIINVLG